VLERRKTAEGNVKMATQNVKMATQEERDAERKRWDAERQQRDQKRLRREATVRRIKDIVWSGVIASVITLIVVLALGWLTTQAVVETARQQGAKDLVALRTGICTVRFQQLPDAKAKLTEFKALSYSDRDAAIRKFVADEKLATMPGEGVPAQGSVEQCADAISNL
jgi:hypothetical protein